MKNTVRYIDRYENTLKLIDMKNTLRYVKKRNT